MADEKSIEDDYCAWIDDNGYGIALKLYLAALMGWPDRTVLLYGGRIIFIEFKDPDTGEQSPQQEYWQTMLEGFGFKYYLCDSLVDAQNITMVEVLEYEKTM